MKLVKLFVPLLAFCSYLGANETSVECEKQPLDINSIDISTLNPMDFHQQMKVYLQLYLSQCPESMSCTEVFSQPITKEYLDQFEGVKKNEAIRRLYTLAVASEILSNPEIDTETGVIENFRLTLEQEYNLSLPKYSVLQLNNENRVSYAYVLFLANGIADFETMLKLGYINELLQTLNLESNHSKRMLLTIMQLVPYIALEEASNLFADDEVRLNKLEEISVKFYTNKISMLQCANRINALCK